MFVCPECGEIYSQPAFCTRDGAQAESAENDPLLGQQVNSYRIARLIGVGGMGRVYKGVNPSIGSRVAIKVLSQDCADNQELVDRFFAEAKAVNVIRHESIVNVLNLDRLPDRRPFIIMEFLDGKPLSQVISDLGQLPLGSFARIIGEALSALGAAHAAGIIHRDLKPDNIFITPHGRAKVLDFGIAKLTGESLGISAQTRDGSLMGTPHYMAPEQAQARPVDPRTDIYSIGVILYEGITGRPPFEAEALYDLLRMHVETAPQPPRAFRQDLPPTYEGVIMRALSKHPDHRQQSAKQLYRELVEATRQLGEQAWEPIGDKENRMSVGMSAIPTPAGPPTPSSQNMFPIGGHTPQRVGPAPSDAPPPGMPTPQGSGQLIGPAPNQTPQPRSRAALWATLGVCAAAAVGAGVFFSMQSSPADAEEPNGDIDPVADDPTTTDPTIVGAHPGNHVQIPTTPPSQNTNGIPGWPMDGNFAGTRPTPNMDAIDVSTMVSTATELARKSYADATLTRIYAQGVRPDGTANITLTDGYTVMFGFLSPKAAERPADFPVGVEYQPECTYNVILMQQFATYHRRKGWCDAIPVGPPKCTLKQIWQKAIKKGVPTGNVVAQIGYWADEKNKLPRWMFQIGDKHFHWLPDNC